MNVSILKPVKLISVVMVILVLSGCIAQTNDKKSVIEAGAENSEWQNESIPEFGINYMMPSGDLTYDQRYLVTVNNAGIVQFTIAVINAYDTMQNQPNAVSAYNWDYFIKNQPIEGASYSKLNFDWKQYHSVKDTFIPNTTINDIPMFLDVEHGTIQYNDQSSMEDQYYYRAHFFIQNGLNYVRVTVPVNVPEKYLETMNEAEIINLMNSHVADESINAQYSLFTEVLNRVTIQDKFINAAWENEEDLACQTPLDDSAVLPKMQLLPGLRSVVKIKQYNKQYNKNDPDYIKILSIDDHYEYKEIFSNLNIETDYQNFEYLLAKDLLIRKRSNNQNGTIRFDLFDFSGATADYCYPSTLPTTQALKFVGMNKYLYTQPKRTKGGAQNDGEAVVFVADNNGDIVDQIESRLLPNWVISSSRVVGWSSDLSNVYVTRLGWEGYEYADLWKVDMNTKNVEHITGADKIALGALNVLPKNDLAVGIDFTEVACTDCMGSVTGGAPASLKIFDLKNNTVHTVYSSEVDTIASPLLSSDGKRIFFREYTSEVDSTLYVMNSDGGGLHEIGTNLFILGMSADGNIIIVQKTNTEEKNQYIIIDIVKGNEQIKQLEGISEDSFVEFMSCSYPLGFNCLYP